MKCCTCKRKLFNLIWFYGMEEIRLIWFDLIWSSKQWFEKAYASRCMLLYVAVVAVCCCSFCSCSCPVPAASRPSFVGRRQPRRITTSPGTTIFKCFCLSPKREMFGNVRMIERILTTLGGNEPWRAMATKQKHFSIV